MSYIVMNYLTLTGWGIQHSYNINHSTFMIMYFNEICQKRKCNFNLHINVIVMKICLMHHMKICLMHHMKICLMPQKLNANVNASYRYIWKLTKQSQHQYFREVIETSSLTRNVIFMIILHKILSMCIFIWLIQLSNHIFLNEIYPLQYIIENNVIHSHELSYFLRKYVLCLLYIYW